MLIKKRINYSKMAKVVKTMRIPGYKWFGSGYAEFKGSLIDLTATSPEPLAVAYRTLSQISK